MLCLFNVVIDTTGGALLLLKVSMAAADIMLTTIGRRTNTIVLIDIDIYTIQYWFREVVYVLKFCCWIIEMETIGNVARGLVFCRVSKQARNV